MLLDGCWQLMFTTTAAGVPPEQLPTPLLESLPAPMMPLAGKLDGIEQQIEVMQRRVINRVGLSPWPKGFIGDALSAIPGGLGGTVGALQNARVQLELDHSFSVEGEGSEGARRAASTNQISLCLQTVRRSLDGAGEDGLAKLIPKQTSYEIPQVVGSIGSGGFETTYVDSEIRISRASFPGRELRVFARVGGDPPEESPTQQWEEEEPREELYNPETGTFEYEECDDDCPSD